MRREERCRQAETGSERWGRWAWTHVDIQREELPILEQLHATNTAAHLSSQQRGLPAAPPPSRHPCTSRAGVGAARTSRL